MLQPDDQNPEFDDPGIPEDYEDDPETEPESDNENNSDYSPPPMVDDYYSPPQVQDDDGQDWNQYDDQGDQDDDSDQDWSDTRQAIEAGQEIDLTRIPERKPRPMPRQASTLAMEIKNEHQLALTNWESVVEHAIRIGELLLEAKKMVGHGGFMSWVEANCPFKHGMGLIYMNMAKHKSALSNSQEIKNLTLTGALKLLTDGRSSKKQVEITQCEPGPQPAGQTMHVKGYGQGQAPRDPGEDDGGTIPPRDWDEDPTDVTRPARLTVEPNLPITDSNEGTGGGGGSHSAPSPAPIDPLKDEFEAWRAVTARFVKECAGKGRGDYQAAMLGAVNGYWDMSRRAS